MRMLKPLFMLGMVLLLATPVAGLDKHLPFRQVVQASRLIFAGTVAQTTTRYGPNGKMIFTDVYFTDTDLVYRDASFRLYGADPIILSFAGGEVNGTTITVSGAPEFKEGERYLLAVKYEDPLVANPASGGLQGIFPIVEDKDTGKWYPLTYDRRGIEEIDGKGELMLTEPVESVAAGQIAYRKDPLMALGSMPAPRPAADSPSPDAHASISNARERKEAPLDRLMELERFKSDIRAILGSTGRAGQ